MCMYGYCRISQRKQSIERQIRNIKEAYPNAIIIQEAFTGTTTDRPQWNKLFAKVKEGDTIIFDSVSRMARSEVQGVEAYEDLYNRGVNLVFLKEPHINTATYKQALSSSVELVGNEIADIYIEATNKVLRLLATKQIELAFGQAQKEVDDLHQRTAEGIETARRKGKRIGTPQGSVLNVKKKAPAIDVIKKSSVRFGGTLNDTQCTAAAKISRKTFYKYLSEIGNHNS